LKVAAGGCGGCGLKDHTPAAPAVQNFDNFDDLKKSILSKCIGPTKQIAAIIEIVRERAEKSGTQIRSEAYLLKALESFDTQTGPDHEELEKFMRKAN
jgi:hypothetical protein